MNQEIMALADKISRAYLFTLNKGGVTERDLTGQEIDTILAALRAYAGTIGHHGGET